MKHLPGSLYAYTEIFNRQDKLESIRYVIKCPLMYLSILKLVISLITLKIEIEDSEVASRKVHQDHNSFLCQIIHFQYKD